MSDAPDRYIPAAGRKWLTALYDPAMALTMREHKWRRVVLQTIVSDPSTRTVLDVGSGTATLLVALAKIAPDLRPIAVDGDSDIVARAAAKANGAGVDIEMRIGRAQALPVDNASVDVVVMSLVLHHLSDDDKRQALNEARRALRVGGRLVVADWGKPHDVVSRGLFLSVQLLDGFETTRANVAGEIPPMIRASGFGDVQSVDRWRTIWGSLELLTAKRMC